MMLQPTFHVIKWPCSTCCYHPLLAMKPLICLSFIKIDPKTRPLSLSSIPTFSWIRTRPFSLSSIPTFCWIRTRKKNLFEEFVSLSHLYYHQGPWVIVHDLWLKAVRLVCLVNSYHDTLEPPKDKAKVLFLHHTIDWYPFTQNGALIRRIYAHHNFIQPQCFKLLALGRSHEALEALRGYPFQFQFQSMQGQKNNNEPNNDKPKGFVFFRFLSMRSKIRSTNPFSQTSALVYIVVSIWIVHWAHNQSFLPCHT